MFSLCKRTSNLTAFSRMAAVSLGTLRACSRVIPAFRNMLILVYAVSVRIRERSSLKTTSRTQKSLFSLSQQPRHGRSNVSALTCLLDELVTAYETDFVTFLSIVVLLSNRRSCLIQGHLVVSIPTVVEVNVRTSKRPRFFSFVSVESRAA